MHGFTGVTGSLALSIIDFALVFVILAILALIMYSFRFLFAKKPKGVATETVVPVQPSAATKPEPELEDDTELVAVIAAAIAAYGEEAGRLVSIKKLSPIPVSMWKLTARREAVGMIEE